MLLSAHSCTLHDATARAFARQDGALADVEALLHSLSPPAAMLAGLRHVLYDQLDLHLDRGPAGTAVLLAWLARHRPGPFTFTVAALTRQPVTVDPVPGTGHEHRLDGPRAAALGCRTPEDLRAWSRKGRMMAGRVHAADVDLTIIPSRIGGWDGDAFKLIVKGEPCGQVLPGLVRAGREAAACWPDNPPVTSSAALAVAGRGFGHCAEQVTGGLIRALVTA